MYNNGMEYLDLTKSIDYSTSSYRYFKPHEHHVKRFMKEDVLLLVFSGVLRFSENGKETEVSAGQYYIQKHGVFQDGIKESDAPRYFYVHFMGSWSCLSGLNKRGRFNSALITPLVKRLDELELGTAPLILKTNIFYEILSSIYNNDTREITVADEIAEFIKENYKTAITLESLVNKFNFSKNHIINMVKEKYGVTPIKLLNSVGIKNACRMLTATLLTVDEIAKQCGFTAYTEFYKAFIKENGITPKEYRNISRK